MSKKFKKKKLKNMIHQNNSINLKENTEQFLVSIEPYIEDIPYEEDDIVFYMLHKAVNKNEVADEIVMFYEVDESTYKKINGIRTYMLFLIESILKLPDRNVNISDINDWFHFSKELLDMSCRPLIRMNEVANETLEKDGMTLSQYSIFKKRITAFSYGCSINEFLIVRCLSQLICNDLEAFLKTGRFNWKDNKILLYILLELLQKPERMSDKYAIKSIDYIVNFAHRLLEWEVIFDSNKKPNFYSPKYFNINWSEDEYSVNVHEFHELYSINYPYFKEDSINSLITCSKTTALFSTITEGRKLLSFAPLLQGVVTPIETELKRIIAYKAVESPKKISFNDAINDGYQLGVFTKEQQKAFHAIRDFRNIAVHTGKLTEDDYRKIYNIIMKEKLLLVLHNYIKLNEIP